MNLVRKYLDMKNGKLLSDPSTFKFLIFLFVPFQLIIVPFNPCEKDLKKRRRRRRREEKQERDRPDCLDARITLPLVYHT